MVTAAADWKLAASVDPSALGKEVRGKRYAAFRDALLMLEVSDRVIYLRRRRRFREVKANPARNRGCLSTPQRRDASGKPIGGGTAVAIGES
jgi:hypothetical protein